MKKFTYVLLTALLVAGCFSLSAQTNELPKYQRSSLHMVLLKTDEPTLPDAIDFSSNITEAWTTYPFPDKYDQI